MSAVALLEGTYRFATYHHNPIEPSATTAVCDSDRLTLHPRGRSARHLDAIGGRLHLRRPDGRGRRRRRPRRGAGTPHGGGLRSRGGTQLGYRSRPAHGRDAVGPGQALLEATRMDPRAGRWANTSLGDYLVPVNADTREVVVDTIEVADEQVNPLGMKGGRVDRCGRCRGRDRQRGTSRDRATDPHASPHGRGDAGTGQHAVSTGNPRRRYRRPAPAGRSRPGV